MNHDKLIDISVNKDLYNVGILKEDISCLNFMFALKKNKDIGDNKK